MEVKLLLDGLHESLQTNCSTNGRRPYTTTHQIIKVLNLSNRNVSEPGEIPRFELNEPANSTPSSALLSHLLGFSLATILPP